MKTPKLSLSLFAFALLLSFVVGGWIAGFNRFILGFSIIPMGPLAVWAIWDVMFLQDPNTLSIVIPEKYGGKEITLTLYDDTKIKGTVVRPAVSAWFAGMVFLKEVTITTYDDEGKACEDEEIKDEHHVAEGHIAQISYLEMDKAPRSSA